MKTGSSLLSLLALTATLVVAPRAAFAADPVSDIETDHVDPYDDEPPSFALLVHPLAMVGGSFGAEGDAVVASWAAVSVDGEILSTYGGTAMTATAGLPMFPGGIVFHGFYLHPRVQAMHVEVSGASADALGGGATVGWEWTFHFGLTLRGGGGLMADHVVASASGTSLSMDLVSPTFDVDAGWVF